MGVNDKIVRILEDLHHTVHIHCDIGGIDKEIDSTIGVKQGDFLGPILFNLFICGVMMAWRAKHPTDALDETGTARKACTFRTREDFKMRGRVWSTGGDVSSKTGKPRAPTQVF